MPEFIAAARYNFIEKSDFMQQKLLIAAVIVFAVEKEPQGGDIFKTFVDCVAEYNFFVQPENEISRCIFRAQTDQFLF